MGWIDRYFASLADDLLDLVGVPRREPAGSPAGALLRDAADWLETHDWRGGGGSGMALDATGEISAGCCIIALGQAHLIGRRKGMVRGGYLKGTMAAAMDALWRHLRQPGKATFGNLVWWNDARGRTKDEVVAALRGAAALADREYAG